MGPASGMFLKPLPIAYRRGLEAKFLEEVLPSTFLFGRIPRKGTLTVLCHLLSAHHTLDLSIQIGRSSATPVGTGKTSANIFRRQYRKSFYRSMLSHDPVYIYSASLRQAALQHSLNDGVVWKLGTYQRTVSWFLSNGMGL